MTRLRQLLHFRTIASDVVSEQPIGQMRACFIRAGLVLAALAFLVSLWRIDGILGALHQPGAASYRIDDLSGATSLTWDAARPQKVLATWQSAPWVPGRDTSPTAVATWYIGLDFVFIAAYATLLWWAVRRLCAQVRALAGKGDLVRSIATKRAKRRGHAGDAAEPDIDHEEALEQGLLETYVGRERWVLGAVVAAAAADVVEDVVQLLMVQCDVHSRAAYVALYAATVAKWVFVVGVGAYIAATAYSVAQRRGRGVDESKHSELRRLIAAAGVLRAQIIVVVAWIGGLFFAEQTPDVLRRWLDAGSDGAARGAAASGVVATVVLCLVVLVSGRLMLRQWRRTWDKALPMGWLLGAGIAILAAMIALVATGHGGLPLVVPGVIAIAVPLTERLLSRAPEGYEGLEMGQGDGATHTLVELLAIAPLVALGLALLHASVADAVFTGQARWWALIAGGILLLGLATVLWCERTAVEARLPGDRAVLTVACVASLLVVLVIELDHWPYAEWVGTIGIVAIFAIVMSGLVYLGTWVSERVRPPRVVLVLRLRRIPVFALVIVWAVLATRLGDGAYHDVRTVHQDHASVTLDGAFKAWLTANRIDTEDPAYVPQSDQSARPLVLVAAEGGGIRAAYWTALAMDCLFNGGAGGHDMTDCAVKPPGTTSVFAASGASGGSVGLAAYMAHQFEKSDDAGWVRERLGGDYVSPTVAQGLFADLPDAFLGIHGLWDDRAVTLERSWEREWPGDQMASLSPSRVWDGGAPPGPSDSHRFPLLLMNGTSVTDGCRVNTSVLNAAVGRSGSGESVARPDACSSLVPFEPPTSAGARADWTLAGTKDLSDFLCPDQDVRLSTAALLSARFPYVTPYGRLSPCPPMGPPTTYDVDGGYLDNTGATPLLQVWSKLEPLVRAYNQRPGAPCIVPLFIQIDNHYVAPAGPDEGARPSQLEAPPLAVKTSRDGEEANARQAAALQFGRIVGTTDDGTDASGYAHIYPQSHPGSQAPLGWTLSAGSMDDLERQLRVQNLAAARVVESWYGGLSATGPAGSGSSWCGSTPTP